MYFRLADGTILIAYLQKFLRENWTFSLHSISTLYVHFLLLHLSLFHARMYPFSPCKWHSFNSICPKFSPRKLDVFAAHIHTKCFANIPDSSPQTSILSTQVSAIPNAFPLITWPNVSELRGYAAGLFPWVPRRHSVAARLTHPPPARKI